MKTTIQIFSGENSKQNYEKFEESLKSISLPPKTQIAAYYFDDEDDEYHFILLDLKKKIIKLDFFSYDELSKFTYEIT